MTNPLPPYRIFPLGDAGITIDFGNTISETNNALVLALFEEFRRQPFPGMIEAVPAYNSLTIYYDTVGIHQKLMPGKAVYEWVEKQFTERLQKAFAVQTTPAETIKIPVCYDIAFGPDLESLAHSKSISIEEIIRLHTASVYRVYMLGFLPGFSYMGQVNETLVTPRKPHPVDVAAGSVGIAGKQTGIYPVHSPGGWQIIGRTPIQLFNRERDPLTFLTAGDSVQFYSISKYEFENY